MAIRFIFSLMFSFYTASGIRISAEETHGTVVQSHRFDVWLSIIIGKQHMVGVLGLWTTERRGSRSFELAVDDRVWHDREKRLQQKGSLIRYKILHDLVLESSPAGRKKRAGCTLFTRMQTSMRSVSIGRSKYGSGYLLASQLTVVWICMDRLLRSLFGFTQRRVNLFQIDWLIGCAKMWRCVVPTGEKSRSTLRDVCDADSDRLSVLFIRKRIRLFFPRFSSRIANELAAGAKGWLAFYRVTRFGRNFAWNNHFERN